jgi:transcription elongation factor GreA
MSKFLTEEGLRKLNQELEQLKTVKRPAVIERIATARELGDLSENGEYHDARDEQGFIEGRIAQLEDMINKSEVIKNDSGSGIINLGVSLLAVCDGMNREFTIVGASEADPSKGFISYESPIGQAFMGKKVGDLVEVSVPKGVMKCEIKEIKAE